MHAVAIVEAPALEALTSGTSLGDRYVDEAQDTLLKAYRPVVRCASQLSGQPRPRMHQAEDRGVLPGGGRMAAPTVPRRRPLCTLVLRPVPWGSARERADRWQSCRWVLYKNRSCL